MNGYGSFFANPDTTQRRINQLEDQLSRMPSYGGSVSASAVRDGSYNRDSNARFQLESELRNLRNQQRIAQEGSKADEGKKRVEDARNEMYGLARGRMGELSNDPMDRMISEALTARINGTDQPYNAETRNALVADRAQQAAHAEQQLLGRMRSGGGSAADPSYQAAMLEAQAARQGAVQDANLEIAQRANLANYDARTGALGQASGFNFGRQDRQTDAQRYLGGLLARETATPTTNLPPNIPTFSQFQSGQRIGGGGTLSDGERLARGIPLGQATMPGQAAPGTTYPYGSRTTPYGTPARQPQQPQQPATNDGMGTWDDGSPYGRVASGTTTQDNWNYTNNPWPTAMPPAAEPDYGNYGKMTQPGTTGQRPTYGFRGYTVPQNAQEYTPAAEQTMVPSQIKTDNRRAGNRRTY